MKGYKGFKEDLSCYGFKYEVGKEYTTDKAKCCNYGFHFCENPLDIFGYYAPNDSRYCEVLGDGQMDKNSGDSKVACTKIKIEKNKDKR